MFFSNESKKVPGYLNLDTPKFSYIDEFVCLRSKCYAYRTKLNGDGNIFKSICKGNSKNKMFKQCYNCIHNNPYNKQCTQYCLR